jgi:hypothetical protein
VARLYRQFLCQCTDYEVPLLRKAAQKAHGALAETERREAEARAAAAASAAAFRAACADWGVPGVNLRAELAAVAARELPALWAALAEALAQESLSDGTALYDAFSAYAHGPADAVAEAPPRLLPLLAAARAAAAGEDVSWEALGFGDKEKEKDNGGATLSDDASGGFDLAAAMAGADAAGAAADAPPTEINWDLGAAAATPGAAGDAPVEISWDIDVSAADADADASANADANAAAAAEDDGISWDIGVASAGAGAGDEADGGAAVEISWDVDADAVAAEAAAQAAQLADSSAPIEARIALALRLALACAADAAGCAARRSTGTLRWRARTVAAAQTGALAAAVLRMRRPLMQARRRRRWRAAWRMPRCAMPSWMSCWSCARFARSATARWVPRQVPPPHCSTPRPPSRAPRSRASPPPATPPPPPPAC